jgi:hypothetical protein
MALTMGCRLLQAAAIVAVTALPTAHAGDVADHIERTREDGPMAVPRARGDEPGSMTTALTPDLRSGRPRR